MLSLLHVFILDCLRAPTLNHGKIVLQNDNDTKYGAVGNVSCDEGFVPSIPTVLCQANGTWPVPTCVRKSRFHILQQLWRYLK